MGLSINKVAVLTEPIKQMLEAERKFAYDDWDYLAKIDESIMLLDDLERKIQMDRTLRNIKLVK